MSTFSRSNYVINAKLSSFFFFAERAVLRFSWPANQTKADSFKPQKAEEAKLNEISADVLRYDLRPAVLL